MKGINEITKTLREKYITFLETAVGLTVGFLWRDLIMLYMDTIIPNNTNILLKTAAIAVITFLFVMCIYVLSKVKK